MLDLEYVKLGSLRKPSGLHCLSGCLLFSNRIKLLQTKFTLLCLHFIYQYNLTKSYKAKKNQLYLFLLLLDLQIGLGKCLFELPSFFALTLITQDENKYAQTLRNIHFHWYSSSLGNRISSKQKAVEIIAPTNRLCWLRSWEPSGRLVVCSLPFLDFTSQKDFLHKFCLVIDARVLVYKVIQGYLRTAVSRQVLFWL